MNLKKLFRLGLYTMTVLFVLACQNEDLNMIGETSEIPESVLEQISGLGYNTDNVERIDTEFNGTGYIVEGDIILHERDLEFNPENGTYLRIAEVEQYNTTLVPSIRRPTRAGSPPSTTPTSISLMIWDEFPESYYNGAREAASRFNDLNLSFNIHVLRESEGIHRIGERPRGSITIVPGGGLAAAGFPFEETVRTRTGTRTVVRHYNEIRMNPNLNTNDRDFLGTVIAHEIGHCIGFRHTDWFNRRFSCGVEFGPDGTPTNPNEDIQFPNDFGAIHIPGTPTSEESGSFMLSCIDFGDNREFTNNDEIALLYLHGL